MATTTFNLADATAGIVNVLAVGRWTINANIFGSGVTAWRCTGNGSGGEPFAGWGTDYLHFTLTLDATSDIEVNLSTATVANCVTVTINGTDYTPTVAGSLTFAYASIVTGLAAGTYEVYIRGNSAGGQFALAQTGFMRVTGAASPTVSRPTGLTGRVYTLRDAGTGVHDGNGSVGNYSTAIVNEAQVTAAANGNFQTYLSNNRDDSIRFRTLAGGSASSAIVLELFQQGGTLVLRKDGTTDFAPVAIPSDGKWALLTVATGVDLSAAATLEIRTRGASAYHAYKLMTVGGLVNTATLSRRRTAQLTGDSIGDGYNIIGPPTSTTLTTSIEQKITYAIDWAVGNRCVSGSSLHDYTPQGGSGSAFTSSSGRGRLADYLTKLPYEPDTIILQDGTNDMANAAGMTGGNILPPTGTISHQTDVQAQAEACLAAFASTKVLIPGIIPCSNVSDATRATWNAARVAARAAMSSPNQARSRYVDPAQFGLVLGATDYAAESGVPGNYLHLSSLGQAKVANALAPHLLDLAGTAPYTVAITGTGLSRTATVTIATGPTFNGVQTITIAWGDGATSTITPAAGATTGSANHTYTAGTYTVAGTNAQDWTDPASQGVTIASPGPTPGTLIGSGIGTGFLMAS